MSLREFAEHHARSAVLVAFALAIAGGLAAVQLPVGLFPSTSFPRVVVNLDAGSRPADQTTLLVTRPVEQAIRTVPGVANVRSATTRGSAQIAIDFGWGRDMVAETLQVDSAIAAVLGSLPPGTAYSVHRMDPTVFPIISYGLLSKTLSPIALRDLAAYQIVPLLSGVDGLSRVDVQGGQTAEVEVLADPHLLAAYGLSLSDLAAAVTAGNTLQAVGRIQDRARLSLLVAEHSLTVAADIGGIVIRAAPAGVLRVRDVARVQAGVVPSDIHVSEDGQPAVLLNVYQQPDSNAVKMAQGVRDKLAGFKLPAGVRLVNWYDQTELVTQSATSVRDAVLIGLGLAAIVLFAFLRSVRVTLIAVVIVPATLAVTALVLSLLGASFNIMTMGGIAAAVGLLIDDVIVMVEHIARRAGAAGSGGAQAVLPAASEFLRPLTGSSLATLIVFLPLSFLTGVTGAFSKALSITMAAALAISYLMTAFVVPLLARSFVDFDRWHDPATDRPGWLGRTHGRMLEALFRRPFILAVVLVPVIALGVVAYQRVPTGFMPEVDEGGFVMDYYTKAGTSLIESERQVSQVDAILSGTPEVATYSRRLGTTLGNDLGESYHGDYFVRLKAGHARSTPDVMAATLRKVQADVPAVDVELAQLMEDLIGDLTAVPQPIEIKLYALDPTVLEGQATKIAAAIGKVSGVVEIKSGVLPSGDAIDIHIDPERAAIQGVTADDVTQAVAAAMTGLVATQLPQPTKAVGVRVRIPAALTLSQAGLADLPLHAADGHMFPLRRVADLVTLRGQTEISRDDLQPMVAVTGRIEGRGIGSAVADVKAVLARPGMLAPGVRYELGGLYAQQQIAFAGLARVFAAALAAEFILLLFLYERFWLPVIIMACSLLSTTAVFTGLWATGVSLNITALMGMTMVIGIGTEMAIFYVSEFVELETQMSRAEALRAASQNRLRPITMTTLAAILTLMPLALAIGAGSEIQQPLAISIIAGLLLQYPLVLVAMPVLIGLTRGVRGSA